MTHDPVSYTVLSRKAITVWAVLVVAVGVGVALWLLLAYGGDDPSTQLDAIRTAGTIVVGTGGAAALLLAARRQRATEIALLQKDRDQAHQQRVTDATEADAEARRITELYTTAAGQLGSDKAPVRLAGLYALERLAQNNPSQRHTIVNVLCAYLRMPFAAPEKSPGADYTERIQEREVRLTAQRVLRDHLRPDAPATFWPDVDLDLTRATLIDFTLDHCEVRTAAFREARFTGITSFRETRFTGATSFREAEFDDHASFHKAHFGDHASFVGTRFTDDTTTFHETIFDEAIPDEITPFLTPTAADDRPPELEPTGRERELLALLGSGSTDDDIAARLGVSIRTVRRMIADLMRHLGAHSRFAAGVRAADRGWVRPDQLPR